MPAPFMPSVAPAAPVAVLEQSNLEFGVSICRLLEVIAPNFGCHVALTGCSLYKDGNRKDLDLIFYRIRQVEKIDYEGFFKIMVVLGFDNPVGGGWIYKTKFKNVPIDMLFPEELEGEDYHASI